MNTNTEAMALYEGTMEDFEQEPSDSVEPWPVGEGLAELKKSLRGAIPTFVRNLDAPPPCAASPELWWSAKSADRAQAADTCFNECPVREACLAHGQAHEKEGIWGGVDRATRKRPQDLCARGHQAWVTRASDGRRYCRTCREARDAS